MSLVTHSAAGQAAGYLFQPERALYWLAECPVGASVGIETEDDVVVRLQSGDAIHEQQKHTIQPSHAPFGDRSKDLWNTLFIWMGAVATGEILISRTTLYLTTNATLPDCIVKRLNDAGADIAKATAELRAAGTNPPLSIKKQVEAVLAHGDADLKALLAKVKVSDGSDATSGLALRTKIAGLLHLPASMAWGDLLDHLSGWVHNQTLEGWRAQRPALITREAFDTQYQRLLQIHQLRFKKAKPEHLLPVPGTQIDSFRSSTFVTQLRATSLSNEESEVTNAILDFIRCGLEQFRLSTGGELTREEVAAFETNLIRRWTEICRSRCKRVDVPTIAVDAARDLGYDILGDAMEHREPLGGFQQEPYITTGSFHRLADNLRVQWNPRYLEDTKQKSRA